MNTIDILEATRTHLGITSDYALAKALCVTQTSISNYKMRRSIMDDDVALRIADILGLNPLAVIAMANSERAKTPEMQARWNGIVAGFRMLLQQAKMGFAQ